MVTKKPPAKVAPVKRRTPRPKPEQTINVSVAAPASKPEAKKDDSEVMRSMLDTMNDGPSDSIETDEDSLAEPTMGGAGAGAHV